MAGVGIPRWDKINRFVINKYSQYYIFKQIDKMNGRRSYDPSISKPFNINIFYNINSRNITNNNEVQSHPVSARVHKNLYQQISNCNKIQSKNKAVPKKRKKKYSVDLGLPTQRKTEKITKKSNSNSISSGFPSQAHQKKDHQKVEADKKVSNQIGVEKNQKKLGQLLQIFSQGKIDKANLTRQIINIFQLPNKVTQQKKQQKIHKKKRSQSTLIGTTTPKNYQQLYKFSKGTKSINAVMGIHNVRKRQSKSQRGSFINSKPRILKQQITEKIIYCKAIDSSLFLQPDDEKIAPIIDRTNDVQTSYSIVLLNENLNKQRKLLINNKNLQNEILIETQIQNIMAIKIQRAWKKYRTRNIIKKILLPKYQPEKTEPNYLIEGEKIQKKENFDDNSMSVQNFLSQELDGKKVIKQRQKARVEQLKDHQMKKWNEIMDFVKISMNNKQLSSDECLKKVIEYFQNAKKTVEKQLFMDKLQLKRNQVNEESFPALDIEKEQQQEGLQNDVQRENESINNTNNIESIDEQSDEGSHIISQSEQSNILNSRVLMHEKSQFIKCLQKIDQDNLSFQVVENALLLYQAKLRKQYKQKMRELDIHCINYLESKRKIEENYKMSKREIKRILSNLHKGYHEAKNILQKNVQLSDDQRSSKNQKSRQSLQKCKSDNYLLKTAINYKKYIQKRQKNEIKSKQNHDISDLIMRQKQLKKIENEMESKSIDSSQISDKSLHRNLENVLHHHIKNDFEYQMMDSKSGIFNKNQIQSEGGEGYILNNIKKGEQNFNRLEQKIFSEQFLQYEEIQKKFDEEQQKSQISMHSNERELMAQEISLFENTKINQMNKKLKSLTTEEKDDIFEFLFIDLALQLITEYDQETTLYNTIRNFVEKKKRFEAIPKGVKTTLNACKEYISTLAKLVVSDYEELFLKHIEVPMGPTAREMLKYMHQEQDNQSFTDDQAPNVPLILPTNIYEKMQSKIVPDYPRIYDDEVKQVTRRKFLKTVDHFHHKALFDSLNQALDMERPYGIWGVPFPWKTSYKTKRNFHISKDEKMKKMKNAVEEVIKYCSCMCGIMADKEDSVFGNHRVTENYIEQIRQDRMSKTLAQQLDQHQDRWQFYEDQQAQVVFELSRYLTMSLVEQFLAQFHLSKHLLGCKPNQPPAKKN